MLYYVKNDKKVEKYQVRIDEDRLSEIELEIKENCNELSLNEIIHGLYKGDTNALDVIYEYEDEIKIVSRKIKNIEKESMDTTDTTKFNELMVYINDLILSKKRLEKNIPYIEKIKDSITFKLISSIKIEKVNEVNDFFENSKDYNYSKVKLKRK